MCEDDPIDVGPRPSSCAGVDQRSAIAPTPYSWLVREWESAYSSGITPQLDVASPYQWASACHDMLEAGYVEVLEFAARHLHAAYPDLEYLATIVAWFDNVPHHLPLAAFRDDPAADVQVIRRTGCDAVLLCFCAKNGTFGLPLNFVHQWLGRLPVSLVYLKDFRDLSGGLGFPSLGSDRSASIAALRCTLEGLDAKRVYTVGVSVGGYAAMYYALELGAAGVLNLAGTTDLTGDFVESLEAVPAVYSRLLSMAPEYAVNLRESYKSATHPPHVLIAFCSDSSDREQAERMASLPNVELIAVESSAQHNVVDPLIRQGNFFSLLQRLLVTDNET